MSLFIILIVLFAIITILFITFVTKILIMIPYYRIEACMLTTVVLLLVMLPAPTNVVGALQSVPKHFGKAPGSRA